MPPNEACTDEVGSQGRYKKKLVQAQGSEKIATPPHHFYESCVKALTRVV
jgi:hypothetical protein